MKLIACKLCKKIVSDDAKFCPHCGVKEPGVNLEKINFWSVIIVISVVLFFIIKCSSTNKTEATEISKVSEITPKAEPSSGTSFEEIKDSLITPTQFKTVKEVIEDFHDYQNGDFEIISKKPLHIRLSPSIIGSSQFPNGGDDPYYIKADTKKAIIYGIYTAFIHTNASEITVTATPRVFNIDSKKHKLLSDYTLILTKTRTEALSDVQNFLPIKTLAELKTDIKIKSSDNLNGLIMHDQWTKQFESIYYQDQKPGLNVFFEYISKNKNNKTN